MGLENTWHVLRSKSPKEQTSKQSCVRLAGWRRPPAEAIEHREGNWSRHRLLLDVGATDADDKAAWLNNACLCNLGYGPDTLHPTTFVTKKRSWGSCADWWACRGRRSHDWHCRPLPEISSWTLLSSPPSGKGFEGQNWRRLLQGAKHVIDVESESQKNYCTGCTGSIFGRPLSQPLWPFWA